MPSVVRLLPLPPITLQPGERGCTSAVPQVECLFDRLQIFDGGPPPHAWLWRILRRVSAFFVWLRLYRFAAWLGAPAARHLYPVSVTSILVGVRESLASPGEVPAVCFDPLATGGRGFYPSERARAGAAITIGLVNHGPRPVTVTGCAYCLVPEPPTLRGRVTATIMGPHEPIPARALSFEGITADDWLDLDTDE